jgi:hypothetical protein
LSRRVAGNEGSITKKQGHLLRDENVAIMMAVMRIVIPFLRDAQ